MRLGWGASRLTGEVGAVPSLLAHICARVTRHPSTLDERVPSSVLDGGGWHRAPPRASALTGSLDVTNWYILRIIISKAMKMPLFLDA